MNKSHTEKNLSGIKEKLIEDSKVTAKAAFDDLPTEDEWIEL